MNEPMGIEARIAWALLIGDAEYAFLCEPRASYGDPERLDLLSARELLELLQRVRTELQKRGYNVPEESLRTDEDPSGIYVPKPRTLHIGKDYRICIEQFKLQEITLQPLQKTVFIFFLCHPEGIRLKERASFRDELLEIYVRICPNQARETCERRIDNLIAPESNAFSEKLYHLNRNLDDVLGPTAVAYKVTGTNGSLRRIPLEPIYVVWE